MILRSVGRASTTGGRQQLDPTRDQVEGEGDEEKRQDDVRDGDQERQAVPAEDYLTCSSLTEKLAFYLQGASVRMLKMVMKKTPTVRETVGRLSPSSSLADPGCNKLPKLLLTLLTEVLEASLEC